MDFFRTLTFLSIILVPLQAIALDADIEKDLQKDLQRSRIILKRAEAKLGTNRPPSAEINALKAMLQDIKASHLLLKERFRERQDAANALGPKAAERQREMSEAYGKALEEYINLIESLQTESRQQAADSRREITIENLKRLLDGILRKNKRPILGSLPYRRPDYPAREPLTEPSIKPAYRGGNKQVGPEDLKSAPEAPITEEIAGLARSLNWNPVLIYEHVKNNIETEWYWGCMKGAEETLRQGSGNDCDQAALLTALLRASGFPTRYVRGTIEFFAGRDAPIEKIKNLTGIKDPLKIAEFFRKAGIPYKPVITGGQITNFRIEHIWVESRIPYANYRGAIIDGHGKTWLGLDTSIKVTGYQYNEPVDIFSEEPAISEQLSDIRDEYLTAIRTETPIEYIRAFLNSQLATRNPEPSYDDLLTTRNLIPENMNILPASMQFDQINISHEYTEIPEELMHKARFRASRQNTADRIQGDNLFDITIDTMKLSNKPIAITYEPETLEDQEIINSYGGLDNTPPYLVRLRPVLTVNGERMIVARDGLSMGEEYEFTIELISPNGIEKIENTHITGNLSVIGIVAQKTVDSRQDTADREQNTEEDNAESILFKEAINYIDRWNRAEEELASLMQLTITRPIPTVVTIGGVIDVTYLLDMPHDFQWKGLYVDADLRAVETVDSRQDTVDREKTFMQLSALQGSILENRIFEDDFEAESISTAKLFSIAGSRQDTVDGEQIATIDETNIDAILPTLNIDDNIKEDIRNAINQNLVVHIPYPISQEPYAISYEDWKGIGYIKENPRTGEAGYMLSGMTAGGMTVTAPEGWEDQQLRETLSKPYTKEHNRDPLSAAKIIKLPATDRQYGTVGKPLAQPLAVLVTDKQGRPVAGAHVTFRVHMGGGDIKGRRAYTVLTGISGKAEAPLTLGKHTKDNPYYLQPDGKDTYPVQAGLNLVTAAVSSRSGEISTDQAFEAYGIPGLPEKIEKIFPRKEITVLANNPAGSMQAIVADRYGNPVSNIDMKFEVKPAESRNPSVPLPEGHRNLKLYRQEQCKNPYPLYPQCGEANYYSSVTIKTQYFGAVTEAVTGNTVNTKYTVRVTAAGLPPEEFTLYSDGYRDQGDYLPPGIYIRHLGTVNEKGEPVNAAKAGKELKAPLTSELFMLYDEYEMEGPYTCIKSGTETDCWRIKATGIVDITPITDGTVTYTPVEPVENKGTVTETENLGNGKYQTRYTTASEPAVNKIEAEGEAVITVPEVFYDPFTNKAITEDYETETLPQKMVTLKTGQEVLFDRDTKQAIITTGYGKLLYTVYGVDVQLAIQPEIILLNERGHTNTDITFRYSILPAEYRAIQADIDLIETDENDKETWIDCLNGDGTQGEGTATAIAGSRFDINRKYEAEAVLNRGTDMEIRSGKETETEGEKKIKRTDIKIARIIVLNDENSIISETDGIKFSDGSKAKKRYHIELKSKLLAESKESCESLSGRLRIIGADGQTISPPGAEYYPAEYSLDFLLSGGKCLVRLKDTTSEAVKDRFILSNLSGTALKARDTELSDIMPLYGGIGNTMEIEINRAIKKADIEPVGVIVIGIDGLRQDVLYDSTEASYTDPEGCGNTSCNVTIDETTLPGLSQILNDTVTVKLQNVTSIFPSITLASWASVFTGKKPKDTGITGNEFFARDINIRVPERYNKPEGIISFGSGAFRGYDKFGILDMRFADDFFVPYQGDWEEPVEPPGAPQNRTSILKAETVYESINQIPGVNKYFGGKGGDINVVANQHYARGAYWLTWDVEFGCALIWTCPSETMDKASWDKLDDYLEGKYRDSEGNRNDVPFSALTVWYLPGLDHEAHGEGMSVYRDYFVNTTDTYINKVVNRLKELDEFDNKIFIITADHGHTAMPTGLKFKYGTWLGIFDNYEDADTSCELKLDFVDPESPSATYKKQMAEKENNNLHIWELGEVFRAVGSIQGTVVRNKYRLLVPGKIEEVFENKGVPVEYRPTSDIDNADIVAAFNGPMAHIYSMIGTDNKTLGEIAEVFRVMLGGYYPDEAMRWFGFSGEYKYLKFQAVKVGRLWKSIDEILIRMEDDNYYVFNGLDDNGEPVPLGIDILGNEYIEAELRITGMNNKDRSGDIVLIMKDKMSDSAIDRFTTGTACKSWHGSLNPSDSYVPLILAYPGGNKKEIEDILRKDTLCKTDYSDCRGNWKLTDIVKEIIREQYQ